MNSSEVHAKKKYFFLFCFYFISCYCLLSCFTAIEIKSIETWPINNNKTIQKYFSCIQNVANFRFFPFHTFILLKNRLTFFDSQKCFFLLLPIGFFPWIISMWLDTSFSDYFFSPTNNIYITKNSITEELHSLVTLVKKK